MKKLETIMKICTVLGFIIFFGGHILMFIIFPGSVIDEAKEDVYLKVLYALLFFDVAPIIIIPFIAKKKFPNEGLFKSNLKGLDKAEIFYENFDELFSKLSEKLSANKYQLVQSDSDGNEKAFVFLKRHGFSLSYFVLIDSAGEKVDVALKKASNLLKQCTKRENEWLTYTRTFSVMLCVNKTTEDFYKFLNSISIASRYDFEFRTGYSFNEKTLYINDPRNNWGVSQLKKMRKFLMNMLEISKDQLRK